MVTHNMVDIYAKLRFADGEIVKRYHASLAASYIQLRFEMEDYQPIVLEIR